MTATTAATVVDELHALADEAELAKVRNRLSAGEAAFGLRMKSLFDTAKAHTDVPLPQVRVLLDHPAYEPRMAALCILDFKARRRRTDEERRELCELYLQRHDAITTWDMVDRAAPRDKTVLHELASSAEPLRRRTALTAPLGILGPFGNDADVAECLHVATTCATDPDPTVHKPVGILLKHATPHATDAVLASLDEHAATMPRTAVRLATEKLPAHVRSRYVG